MAKRTKISSTSRQKPNAEAKLKEDILFLKDSAVFILLCIVAVFTLNMATSARPREMLFPKLCTSPFLPYEFGRVQLPFIFGVLFVIALGVFAFLRFIKKTDESLKYFSSFDAVCLTGFAFIYCELAYATMTDETKLLIFTAISGVLYYISRFYNRDFLWFYIFNISLCFNIWSFFGGIGSVFGLAAKIAGVLFTAISLYFAYAAMKKRGNTPFIKWPFLLTAVVFAALITLLALNVTPLDAAYAMIVMLIQFIAVGVYYTVKILN